jgi:peptide/nickel transport system substrate-binding protein
MVSRRLSVMRQRQLSLRSRLVAPAAAAVVLAACSTTPASPHASPSVRYGGLLRVVDVTGPVSASYPWDQTLDWVGQGGDTGELLRCCLARTLLSYVGQPTDKGGSVLRPDLASALPDVSSDGLTWTFRLRSGLHYGPPLRHVEITVADIVRALQRAARVTTSMQPLFSVIQGFDDYAAGRTTVISGLQTPDAHTLVVRLTQPAGDLGDRFSVPATAPLAPMPADRAAPYGVATGHDNGDSGFLVSSGPYMLEGSSALDFTAAPEKQVPASGYLRSHSITLVRNPSWNRGIDQLRPAYADRVVITFSTTSTDAAAAIDDGAADIVINPLPAPQAPLDQVRRYRADPSLGRVDVESRDGIRYVSMNTAVPPFDDVTVRRAVAFAIDPTASVAAYGGPLVGTVTGHLALDSMEDDALLNYNPYRATDAHARLQRARAEMAKSRYDPAHSGMCSMAPCNGVTAFVIADQSHPAAVGEAIAAALPGIGIHLALRDMDTNAFFTALGDPSTRIPMGIGWGWGKDYPNGSDFFVQPFSSQGFATQSNFSTLGATTDQLHTWGYRVSAVPSVDDRIGQCVALEDAAQSRCWADLDEYMMDKIVPVVPLFVENHVQVVPARLSAYSFDQAFNLPALDQIAVAR